MLGLLRRILIGKFSKCQHQWVINDVRTVSNDTGARYSRYILQCKHCGDVCKKDMD